MKLKYLALAVAITFSAPAMAAVPVSTQPTSVFTTYSGAETLFSSWKTAWTTAFNTIGTQGTDWTFSEVQIPSLAFLLGQFSTTPSASTNFGANFSFINGTAVYSLPAVAVPGPEAGAGLGALAMGGMAFWIARRRKESTAP